MSDTWGTSGSAPEPSDDEPVSGAARAARPHRSDRSDRPARERTPEPTPDWLRSSPYRDRPEPAERDPVAVAAVACGFLGIVFLGIVMALVTAVLAGLAGQRARESGRTFELPYLAFGLAFVDGVVWFVIHYLTKTPIWVG